MSLCRVLKPVLGVAAMLAPLPASADMGLAPAKPGDVYISGEGGYLLQDGLDVNVYGISTAPGTVRDAEVSADDGWFGGVMIGYENGKPIIFTFLPFTRMELYVYGGETDDDRADNSPPLNDITVKSVDGTLNVIGGTAVRADTERQTVEFGYRSEFDDVINETTTVTWGLVSFFRNVDEETDVLCVNICGVQRHADVETWMWGSMVVMEPELRLTPGVALVGRAGVGYYSYDSEGTFRSSSSGAGTPDPFAATVKDDDDGFGFRGVLGAGIKFIFGPQAFLETYAEADYFSDVGVAVFSNSNPVDGSPSRVDTEEMWELRAGARLTIGLGSN